MAGLTAAELKRQFDSYKIEMQRTLRQMGETIEELEARIQKLESKDSESKARLKSR